MVMSIQAFFTEAMSALHITEFTGRIPNLNTWLLGIGAFGALLCCFFGYRLRNLWFAGVCGIMGCIVGTWLYSTGRLDINFSTALALLAGTLFVFTYKLSPATLTFTLVFPLLIYRFQLSVTTALILGGLLSIAAMFLPRWILTCLTAFLGSWALLNLLAALGLNWLLPATAFLQANRIAYLLCLSGLTLLGFLCQAELWGNQPLFHFKAKR